MSKYICLVTPLITLVLSLGCVTPLPECEEMCTVKEELRELEPRLFFGTETLEECIWTSVEEERSPGYCTYMTDYYEELIEVISAEREDPTYYDPDNDGEPN